MIASSNDPTTLPAEIQLALRLESIFMPHATAQRRRLYESQTKFVHYTSAEAALSIIKSKRLWMRNTTCMSDYREVHHGFDMVNNFFREPSKMQIFTAAIDDCYAGAASEAIALFNQWWKDIQLNTYISSISEHDTKEDLHGRLSMWRAFGGTTAGRVAMVINIPFYSTAGIALNLLFSPVAYLTEDAVHNEILKVVENIRGNCDFLRTVDRSRVIAMLFNMLLAAVVCLKHEGFHEEREWRVIYAPTRNSISSRRKPKSLEAFRRSSIKFHSTKAFCRTSQSLTYHGCSIA